MVRVNTQLHTEKPSSELAEGLHDTQVPFRSSGRSVALRGRTLARHGGVWVGAGGGRYCMIGPLESPTAATGALNMFLALGRACDGRGWLKTVGK